MKRPHAKNDRAQRGGRAAAATLRNRSNRRANGFSARPHRSSPSMDSKARRLPAIARSSGITAGAIYKHFKSKGELTARSCEAVVRVDSAFHSKRHTGAATELPRLASVYTEPELKLVRQLSIEVHAAASRDSEVRRVLALSDEAAILHIGDAISIAQGGGKLDPKLNPDFAARLFCIFVMGLLHMDTLLPNLIGDKSWRDFVHERISVLIGAR